MHCPKCDYHVESINSLRIHAAKQHCLPSEELYLAVVSGGIKPTCKCGCGETTSFISLQKGYNEFIQGHAARVNNNWGHNAAAREKSLKKRRDEGLWSKDPWNRGKTKETDARLARAGETMSLKNGERYAKLMSKNRREGVIPSLRGVRHPKWKGGTSALGAMCHGDSRLYKQWKLPKLQAAGFKCTRCGSDRHLHVHHDGVRMAVIIGSYRDQLPEGELTHEQKLWVVDRVVEHHEREAVSGVVLCEQCHEAEHESLNFSCA
jgi:hypothetical protein